MDFIQLSKESGIALVQICRPKALNALNSPLLEELSSCFTQLEGDPETAAVIMTGEGERAFVAGADIKELKTLDTVAGRAVSSRGQAIFNQIEQFPKPVIAAINGFALGGGCELALACHLRFASEKAKMGLPEVGLGLIPGYGGTQRLSRLVGKGKALELILTGDMINAREAWEIGLVNRIVEPENLLDVCRKVAQTIISRGPLAVRFALESVHRGLEMSQDDGERLESSLFGILASTEDAKEGLSAFLEKRKAEFKGR